MQSVQSLPEDVMFNPLDDIFDDVDPYKDGPFETFLTFRGDDVTFERAQNAMEAFTNMTGEHVDLRYNEHSDIRVTLSSVEGAPWRMTVYPFNRVDLELSHDHARLAIYAKHSGSQFPEHTVTRRRRA